MPPARAASLVRGTIAGPRVALASSRHLGTYPVVGGDGWSLVGQDGGQSIDLGDRTLFVFSDTLLAVRGGEHLILANTAAIGADSPDLRAALAGARYLDDAAGRPRQIIAPTPEEAAGKLRFWPAHGILLDGLVHIFYMGVVSDDVRDAWSFENRGIGLALLDPETGSCERVTRGGTWCLWPNRWQDVHVGVQVLREGEHVYVFGTIRRDLSPMNDAIVGRVLASRVRDADAYEFLAGGGRWTADMDEAASLGPCAAEYSVSFNPYLGVYTMVYVDGERKTLMLRTADAVTGPYGPPLLAGTVSHHPTSEMVFLGFEHPRFREEGGRVVHISYSEPRFARNSLVRVRFA